MSLLGLRLTFSSHLPPHPAARDREQPVQDSSCEGREVSEHEALPSFPKAFCNMQWVLLLSWISNFPKSFLLSSLVQVCLHLNSLMGWNVFFKF